MMDFKSAGMTVISAAQPASIEQDQIPAARRFGINYN
jgi:hypothetical protein